MGKVLVKDKDQFRLYGLFGSPLGHSLSAPMHEAAFAQNKIRAYYLLLDLKHSLFSKTMKGIRDSSLSGFNVTVPYKETVIPFLDGLTREAVAIGAVNTVSRLGKRWIGTNTDVYGFMTSLRAEARFSPRRKRVFLIGAGGAARAVIYGLAKAGISKMTVMDCDGKRARKLVRYYRRGFPKTVFEVCPFSKAQAKLAVQYADLVINATPVGLQAGDPSVIPAGDIPRARGKNKKIFFDLIYYPDPTPFLKAARSKGHKTVNGLGMLVWQGARAFEIWTRQKSPVTRMRAAVAKALEERSR